MHMENSHGMDSRIKRSIRLRISVVIPTLLFCLAGCAVGPDYVKPQAPEMTEWMATEDAGFKRGPLDAAWWELFDDPVLDALIETAYHQNLTLEIAGIRILEARAQLEIALGNRWPQSQQIRGNYTAIKASEHTANSTPGADFDYGMAGLGFDAAWEMDFWGKFRRAVESGSWNLDATIATYNDILISLTAEVARAYILIRTLETRLAIARDNVGIQERSYQIARVRYDGGEVTELDVAQAAALLGDTQASIPRLEGQLRQTKNGLALLLGVLPDQVDDQLEGTGQIPTVTRDIAVGVPADLLRRRPDIRVAEGQMAAQSALIGMAKADLFPHFSLFGSIGFAASNAAVTAAGFPGGSSLGDLFSSDSLEYHAGLSFGWDIFNYGRIKNNVRLQDARFQQLIANYKNTVLKAAQEVENGMSAFLKSREEISFLTAGVDAANRSVTLSSVQYKEGLVDYQRVIDTQRFRSQLQDLLTATQGTVALNLVSIYKSLGGGWEIRQEQDFIPVETQDEMRQRTDWGNLIPPAESETDPAQ